MSPILTLTGLHRVYLVSSALPHNVWYIFSWIYVVRNVYHLCIDLVQATVSSRQLFCANNKQ